MNPTTCHDIDLVLTTVDPLHISSGETGLFLDPETGFYIRSGTIPATRMNRIRLAQSPTNSDEVAGREEIPLLKGNGIRGRIHRECANVVLELVRARGEKVSLDTFHILTCGSRTANPDATKSISRTIEAAKHPYSGLFGGGPQLFRSRLVTGAAYPVGPRTIDIGMVDSAYAEYSVDLAERNLLQPITFTRGSDLLRFASPIAPSVVKDYPDSLVAWYDLVLGSQAARAAARQAKADERQAKAQDRAAGKSKAPKVASTSVPASDKPADPASYNLNVYAAIEVVVPGVTFVSRQKVETDMPGPAAFGLYLHGLMGIAKRPYFGGWNRDHLGFVRLQAKLHQANGLVDVFTNTNGVPDFNLAAEPIAKALDAWAEFAPTVTAQSLEDLYRPNDSEAAA